MKGSVYKRKLPSGTVTWAYQVDMGYDEAGKRIRIAKTGFERKQDAQAALTQLLAEKNSGSLIRPNPQTFTEFMTEWFEEYARHKCAPKTVERYRQLAAYTYPHIGAVRLQEISTLMLQRVLNKLKESGGHDRKTKQPRPLSAKTIHHIASLIHAALDIAIEWSLLKTNPVSLKNLPKVTKREAVPMDADRLLWYADAARAAGLWEFVMVAGGTGCRRGELLALRWDDIDFIASTMSITKSLEQTKAGLRIKPPKQERSRLISLAPPTIEILRAVQQQQEHHKRLYGTDYRKDLNLVFCGPDGGYLRPDSVSSKCSLIAMKAGLKNTSLHTVRHAHGSQLLSEGVPLPTVSKRLGHSSVRVTAEVYSHALPKDEAEAADKWGEAISRAMDRQNSTKVV
jgi:integrase